MIKLFLVFFLNIQINLYEIIKYKYFKYINYLSTYEDMM